MIATKEVKEFCESNIYQSAILELKRNIPNISFTPDDTQMYNIFSKMIFNSELDIKNLESEIIINLKNIIHYGKLRLIDQNYNEEDFLDGYDGDEKSQLISFSYSRLILIQIVIEYFFITRKTRKDFMAFLKKQKIPSASKFLDEIYDLYSKSNIK